MAHFLRPLCVRRWGTDGFLPRVCRLPALLVHCTGTPPWSDPIVRFSCVSAACVEMRSKKVQVDGRVRASARGHSVASVYEVNKANITMNETQMFACLLVLWPWGPRILLTLPSGGPSSTAAALRRTAAPAAGAAAPDGGSAGCRVGRLSV